MLKKLRNIGFMLICTMMILMGVNGGETEAASVFKRTITDVPISSANVGSNGFRNWSVSVTGSGTFTGRLFLGMYGMNRELKLKGGKFVESSKIDGFEITGSFGGDSVNVNVMVTNKTAAEIQSYINSNIYISYNAGETFTNMKDNLQYADFYLPQEVTDANNFITKSFTLAGTVITETNGNSLQAILDSETAYNALSDAAKVEVDKTLDALKAGVTYADLLASAKTYKIDKKASIDTSASEKSAKLDALSLLDTKAISDAKTALTKAAEDAKSAIDAAGDEAGIQAAIDAFNAASDKIVADATAKNAKLQEENDKAVAKEFADTYLRTAKNTKVYNEVTSANVDQILSGADAYDALSDAQKAALNTMIADESDFTTYEDYTKAAEELLEKNAADFIKNHLTKDGSVITSATEPTNSMILQGEADWNKLSKSEQMVIDLALKELGATQTYAEMLTSAKTTESFIKEHVSDKTGTIYKAANKDNYAQILEGKDAWNTLSQSEKDAVNKTLLANGGNSYEDLLVQAEKIKAEGITKETTSKKNEGTKNSVKTGDETNAALWIGLLGLSAGACILMGKKRHSIQK